MIRRPPRFTRTDTLFPYTTLFRSLAEVVAAFGADVLAPDGALDRAAMRRRIFDDDNARVRLEAIIHPRVRAALHATCTAAPGAYAIAAIPLLAEGGGRSAYPWLDRLPVVDVPGTVQPARLPAPIGGASGGDRWCKSV